MAAVRAEHAATFDRIESELGERVRRAEEEVLVLEHSDPTDFLNTRELESANARKAFVSDECFTMPLDKLAARLKAVLAKGDRAAMFNYMHHAAQRVGDEPPVEPASAVSNAIGPSGSEEEEEAGAGEVRELVAALRRKLDPRREDKLA